MANWRARVALVFILAGAASASVAQADGLDEEWFGTLKERLMQTGRPGTLTAPAAEQFGLDSRAYSERFIDIGEPDGSRRSIELVSDADEIHFFFSQRTGAQSITIRSDGEGRFMTGFERPLDSPEATALTGNEGRVFLQAQIGYWQSRLARKPN